MNVRKVLAGFGIIILLIMVVGVLWTTRPIIYYNMREMPAYYPNSSKAPRNVSLSLKNVGGIDLHLKLIVTVTNAKIISGDLQQDTIQLNRTRKEFNVNAIRNIEYVQKLVNIYPEVGAKNFTIKYIIEDNSFVLSINCIIGRLFLEKQPYFPTDVFYELDGSDNYRLTESSS
jgi:hypothetical protein